MSLNLKKLSQKLNRKKLYLRIVASLLIVTGSVLLGFYAYWYYTGEKVIDLDIPINVSFLPENSDVVEQEVTTEEVKTYNVPADQPRYLTIEQLGIRQARILAVGLDKDNRIGTPVNIYDAAWFNQSGKPGQTKKVIFLDGHNGGPTKDGIFKHLPKLAIGTIIQVERGDGTVFKYTVTENYIEPLATFDATKMQQVMTPINQQETLAIISCTGKWIQATRTYTDRVVIKAVKIN